MVYTIVKMNKLLRLIKTFVHNNNTSVPCSAIQ